MIRKLAVGAAAASISVFALVGTADAKPAPADGTCVSKGVRLLGGQAVSAAARGQVLPGVNAVPVVILDHVFNNADVTEGLLNVTICE